MKSLNISAKNLTNALEALHENNPMMGHRGVRLGVTYPEVTEVQVRSILKRSKLIQEGKKPFPEIMIPVTCVETELKHQYEITQKVYKEVCEKFGMKEIPHLV